MHTNPSVRDVIESPITEAYSWVADRGAADLIDVSQAVPGYPPPESLRRHVAELAMRPDLHRYTDQLGTLELRSAFAADLTRCYGGAVEVAQVAITAGCNQAFCLVADALAGPGDEMLVPLPYYFNHDMWLRARGIRPVYVPCDDAQLPLLEECAKRLGRRSRAIVLVSPNNPTGAVYPPDLLRRFHDLARDAGIALLLDETYRDFRAERQRPHDLFELKDWSTTLVHLYSFSKVFCLPGYRVGAIAADPALLFEVAKLMDCVAICPPRLGQEAALFGLEHLADWRESNRLEMSGRLSTFRRALAAADDGGRRFEIAAAGAYFAFLRHPFAGESSRAVASRLARQTGVLTLAGEMFGEGLDRFLRVAFANLPAARIPLLVQRLAAAAAR